MTLLSLSLCIIFLFFGNRRSWKNVFHRVWRAKLTCVADFRPTRLMPIYITSWYYIYGRQHVDGRYDNGKSTIYNTKLSAIQKKYCQPFHSPYGSARIVSLPTLRDSSRKRKIGLSRVLLLKRPAASPEFNLK